jgi:small subunit ribosomal protein S4e
MVVRDLLKLSRTMRETKHLLSTGVLMIDGKVRKEHQYPTGLFDIITIPAFKKSYRLVLDQKGRMMVKEIPHGTPSPLKPVKVIQKSWVKGAQNHIQTHDGNTYRGVDAKISVGDSILIASNGKKIESHLPLAHGCLVFITGGTHVGEVAQVKGVVPGTMRRDVLVDLTEGSEKFQTTAKNVMVIDQPTVTWIKQTMSSGGKDA